MKQLRNDYPKAVRAMIGSMLLVVMVGLSTSMSVYAQSTECCEETTECCEHESPSPKNVSGGLEIGATVTDFTLPDLDGKNRSLTDLKGKKGTLLIFVSTQCPYSNAYHERMMQIAQEYRSQGITTIGINSNAKEPVKSVRAHADANRLSFDILKDNQNKIADYLGAQVTPEAFLLDHNNKLIYHGRIDNARDLSKVKTRDLREAAEALLADKQVEKPTVRAFGCTIDRVK